MCCMQHMLRLCMCACVCLFVCVFVCSARRRRRGSYSVDGIQSNDVISFFFRIECEASIPLTSSCMRRGASKEGNKREGGSTKRRRGGREQEGKRRRGKE